MRAIVVFAAAAAGLLLLEAGPEEGRWERAGAAEHGHGRLGAAAEHRRGGWERTAAPANGLSGLEAVRVGGRVVVVGGADYDQTRVKALVFDLESGRWSRAARSRLPWRAGHSVVAANGRVIVWGGFGRIEGLRRGGGRRSPARRARRSRNDEHRGGGPGHGVGPSEAPPTQLGPGVCRSRAAYVP